MVQSLDDICDVIGLQNLYLHVSVSEKLTKKEGIGSSRMLRPRQLNISQRHRKKESSSGN